jgi:hypothetical protein
VERHLLLVPFLYGGLLAVVFARRSAEPGADYATAVARIATPIGLATLMLVLAWVACSLASVDYVDFVLAAPVALLALTVVCCRGFGHTLGRSIAIGALFTAGLALVYGVLYIASWSSGHM